MLSHLQQEADARCGPPSLAAARALLPAQGPGAALLVGTRMHKRAEGWMERCDEASPPPATGGAAWRCRGFDRRRAAGGGRRCGRRRTLDALKCAQGAADGSGPDCCAMHFDCTDCTAGSGDLHRSLRSLQTPIKDGKEDGLREAQICAASGKRVRERRVHRAASVQAGCDAPCPPRCPGTPASSRRRGT